jgi:hypothetical protein
MQNSILLCDECGTSVWKAIRGCPQASLHALSLWQDDFLLVSKVKR